MAKQKNVLRQAIPEALSLTVTPWRKHNQIDLLLNAEVFFPAMLEAIGKAKHSVFLEMYLFESGIVASKFIEIFLAIAERGVKIYLLLDGFGSLGLNSADRKRLRHENIHIRYYNPIKYFTLRQNLFRDHRKILIIDQEVAFVGGVGITDEFETFNIEKLGWRETVIATRGECVADWVAVFSQVWGLYADNDLPTAPQIAWASNAILKSRVICALGVGRQGIKKSLLKRIRHSKRVCWIATAYFVPSFKIRRALCRAARRGVDVRLLLPGKITDHPPVRFASRRFYYRLLKAGARIYEYQPRFMHQKILLCDDWVSIGSSNIDRWNFRWNLEANQEMVNPDFAYKIKQLFEEDFSQSRRYLLSDWVKRSRYHRALEWMWGRVDRLLERYVR